MKVPGTTGLGAAGVMNGTGKAEVGEERKQVGEGASMNTLY